MPTDRRALFARALGPPTVAANPGDSPELRRQCEARLRELQEMEPLSSLDLHSVLAENGIKRRSFLGWVSATTAALMLPQAFEPMVAQAATLLNRVPVLWIEGQSCRGNSEALLRSAGPTIDELLFSVISLEFHQLLMAGAGFQAEQRKQDAAKAYAGRYILVVEGSIPTGQGGGYATTGAGGTTFLDEITQLSGGAAAVIAVGACATYAALPGAVPDPTGAVSVTDVVKNKPVINIPACPMNPANFVGTLLHYTLTGAVPALDTLLRPTFAFGRRIHDACERRAHFDAGEFVGQWGDAPAQNNFCLYKMGCKGPMTYNNCPTILYNEGTSWPVQAGHGCIGCSEPAFWDLYATERPMAAATVDFPGLFGWGVESSVDRLGVGLLAATAVGIGVHAVASAVASSRAVRPRPAAAADGPAPSGPPAAELAPGEPAPSGPPVPEPPPSPEPPGEPPA
jgi:quinone-reactive Ni/Fe-hydrogenase small subunit